MSPGFYALLACAAPLMVAGDAWGTVYKEIPSNDNWWYIYGTTVDLHFSVDCTTAPINYNAQSCIDYQQKFVVQQQGLGTIAHSMTGITGADIPQLLLMYDLNNWGELAPVTGSASNCSSPDNVCMRMFSCTIHARYWANIPQSATHSNDVLRNPIPLHDGACNMCAPSKCLSPSCPNGKYTQLPGPLTLDDVTYQMPTCVSCPPGSWLTCQQEDSCTYIAPTGNQWRTRNTTGTLQWRKQNRLYPGTNIPMPDAPGWEMPMEQCYPCALARNRFHYGEYPDSSDSDTLFRDGFLSFFCPGDKGAPQRCPPHMVALASPSPKSRSDCLCAHGYYMRDTVCVPCDAGSFCTVTGGKQRCPDDTYSYAGMSACTACTKFTALCSNDEALTRCVEGHQARDAYCVPCTYCLQLAQGGVPCYRIANRTI